MRIAMLDWVCEPLRPGTSGLSDIVWDLGRRLAALGDEIIVVAAYDQAAVAPTGLSLLRIRRPRAWQRNVLGQWMTCLALARALARIPTPDVVFAPEYLSIAMASSYWPGLPTAFTTPGNIFERIANGNPFDWTTTQVYKLAALTSARRSTRIVALSEQMRYWWIKSGAASERVSVVPLGIDTKVFSKRAGARERVGIDPNVELALYAGRFSIEKNLPTLIEAAANVGRSRPNFRLRLIGGGPEEDRMQHLVRKLGAERSIEMTGWVPKEQIPDYYRAADVFTLPSTSEPLARALLEAMACETFTIASEAGGTPDVIRSGQNGLLVDARDVDAWQNGIERALAEPAWRAQLARRGHDEVHRRFNWPTITQRFRDEVLGPVAEQGHLRRARRAAARPADPTPSVFYLDYVPNLSKPGASGLSDIVWDMATEFARQGGDAHVFGPYAENPRPDSGVTLHTFPIPPPGYRNVLGHIAISLAALRAIENFGRPGIIHAPEYLSTGVVAPLSRKLPVVMTVPGSIYEKIATGNNPYDATMTPVLRLTARSSARYCARVIATSQDMERWWGWTGTPRHRLVRIPLGVDVARFRRETDARERLGLAPDEKVLLSVGRLNPENGLDTLVASLPGVVRQFPKTRLLIAGTGPEREPLEQQARSLGVAERINFLGWVDTGSLARYYSAADLFVFTALAAGLPRVMLEAMACRTPVVASSISGVIDHIVHGETGYLVPAGSPFELERGIVAALGDPRRDEVAAAGQHHVCADLSWANVMRQMVEQVYRPLIPAVKGG